MPILHPSPLIHAAHIATQQVFLRTTDTVEFSGERTWTLGGSVPSKLSHAGAIFCHRSFSLYFTWGNSKVVLSSRAFCLLLAWFLSKSPWKKNSLVMFSARSWSQPWLPLGFWSPGRGRISPFLSWGCSRRVSGALTGLHQEQTGKSELRVIRKI